MVTLTDDEAKLALECIAQMEDETKRTTDVWHNVDALKKKLEQSLEEVASDVEKRYGESISIIRQLIEHPRNAEIIAEAERWLNEDAPTIKE
jgi:hypothetical protein